MDERSERIAKRFEVPLLVAAVLVIPAIIVEESSVGEPWNSLAVVLNYAIWTAFLVSMDAGGWLALGVRRFAG